MFSYNYLLYLSIFSGYKISHEHFNSSKFEGCRLGDQFHEAGSSWHPYLPPNGFDECVICTCDPLKHEVSCEGHKCPPLNCTDKAACRPHKKACCKVCPEVCYRMKIIF